MTRTPATRRPSTMPTMEPLLSCGDVSLAVLPSAVGTGGLSIAWLSVVQVSAGIGLVAAVEK